MVQPKYQNDLEALRISIECSISEVLNEFDLTEWDWEYGYERDISFNEYPQHLKHFLSSAWNELEKIDEQLS